MDRISFREDNISKIPAIELLKRLGYVYLVPEEALRMRETREQEPNLSHANSNGISGDTFSVFGY